MTVATGLILLGVSYATGILWFGWRMAQEQLAAEALHRALSDQWSEHLLNQLDLLALAAEAMGLSLVEVHAAFSRLISAVCPMPPLWALLELESDPGDWAGWLAAAWQLYRSGGQWRLAFSEAVNLFRLELSVMALP